MAENKLIVSKGNALARAIQTLDVTEAKVMEYCLATIYYKEVISADKVFTVDIDTLAKVCNMDRSLAYRELKRVVIGIRNKEIRLPKLGCEGKMVATSWVSEVEYNDDLAQLELRLSPAIISYITGDSVLKNFVTYKLDTVIHFRNLYSNRLYCLLKSYAHVKARFQHSMGLTELREYLSVPDSSYKAWGNLKVVIQRTLDEINEKSDIVVEMAERKKNGKVAVLVFSLAVKD